MATWWWFKSVEKTVGNQRNLNYHFTIPLMQVSMENICETERFYLNLSNHKAQDRLLWMNVVLSPSPISLTMIFIIIHEKLPEWLKPHDQSYITILLPPLLFANYSSTKRTHTLARLIYMQDESTNNIHLLHKKC